VARARVVVQERHRLFREGVALILGAEPDMEVVATAADARELVAACEEHRPDAVILEVDAIEWDVARLIAALRKRQRSLRVIGVYVALDKAAGARAYQAGARALVARTNGYGPVIDILRSPGRRHPVASLPDPAALPCERPLLTPREVEVLRLIGLGGTTREVSEKLGISPKTVENHKQRIFGKLEVQNQAHAIAVALRQGLLVPETQTEAG
jgi:DNA-binding NarL/FixJ family response regulator